MKLWNNWQPLCVWFCWIVYIIHMVFPLEFICSSRQHALLDCFYTYLTLGSTLKCNVKSRFIKPGWLYIHIYTYVYEKGAASEIMRRETHLKQIPNNYTKLVLNLKHSIFSQFRQYIICSGLFASWYFSLRFGHMNSRFRDLNAHHQRRKVYIAACGAMQLGEATGWELLSHSFKEGGPWRLSAVFGKRGRW